MLFEKNHILEVKVGVAKILGAKSTNQMCLKREKIKVAIRVIEDVRGLGILTTDDF